MQAVVLLDGKQVTDFSFAHGIFKTTAPIAWSTPNGETVSVNLSLQFSAFSGEDPQPHACPGVAARPADTLGRQAERDMISCRDWGMDAQQSGIESMCAEVCSWQALPGCRLRRAGLPGELPGRAGARHPVARARHPRPGHLAHHSSHGLRQGVHAAVPAALTAQACNGCAPLQYWRCPCVAGDAHLAWGLHAWREAAGMRR